MTPPKFQHILGTKSYTKGRVFIDAKIAEGILFLSIGRYGNLCFLFLIKYGLSHFNARLGSRKLTNMVKRTDHFANQTTRTGPWIFYLNHTSHPKVVFEKIPKAVFLFKSFPHQDLTNDPLTIDEKIRRVARWVVTI